MDSLSGIKCPLQKFRIVSIDVTRGQTQKRTVKLRKVQAE